MLKPPTRNRTARHFIGLHPQYFHWRHGRDLRQGFEGARRFLGLMRFRVQGLKHREWRRTDIGSQTCPTAGLDLYQATTHYCYYNFTAAAFLCVSLSLRSYTLFWSWNVHCTGTCRGSMLIELWLAKIESGSVPSSIYIYVQIVPYIYNNYVLYVQ